MCDGVANESTSHSRESTIRDAHISTDELGV